MESVESDRWVLGRPSGEEVGCGGGEDTEVSSRDCVLGRPNGKGESTEPAEALGAEVLATILEVEARSRDHASCESDGVAKLPELPPSRSSKESPASAVRAVATEDWLGDAKEAAALALLLRFPEEAARAEVLGRPRDGATLGEVAAAVGVAAGDELSFLDQMAVDAANFIFACRSCSCFCGEKVRSSKLSAPMSSASATLPSSDTSTLTKLVVAPW